VQQLLLIQVPYLMFPFARRVVADVVRDGGMPPLVIEPIDFANLYQQRMAQAAQQPVGSA
jgi:preprotein translocase subunit SecB